MHFSLTSLATVLLATTQLVAADSPLNSRPVSAYNSQLNHLQIFEHHVPGQGVQLIQARDLQSLQARAQTTCGNQGKISRNKFDPDCLPSNSKGFKSAHNCQGKTYLCVQGGKGICMKVKQAQKLSAEGGECFL